MFRVGVGGAVVCCVFVYVRLCVCFALLWLILVC